MLNKDCKGIIYAYFEDLAYEDIVCMRLKSDDGSFPIITYKRAFYSQFRKSNIGEYINDVRKISLEELMRPEYRNVYERYIIDSNDLNGKRLNSVVYRNGLSLFVHTTDQMVQLLVVALEFEILEKTKNEFLYWEFGYTYQDAYVDFLIPANE